MNQANPNINISFEDGLSFDINEEEIIKNIDFCELDKDNNNNIQNENRIIPASELINKEIQNNINDEGNNGKSDIHSNCNLNNNNNSSKMTNMNMPCVYTGEKGGMKSINHEKDTYRLSCNGNRWCRKGITRVAGDHRYNAISSGFISAAPSGRIAEGYP